VPELATTVTGCSWSVLLLCCKPDTQSNTLFFGTCLYVPQQKLTTMRGSSGSGNFSCITVRKSGLGCMPAQHSPAQDSTAQHSTYFMRSSLNEQHMCCTFNCMLTCLSTAACSAPHGATADASQHKAHVRLSLWTGGREGAVPFSLSARRRLPACQVCTAESVSATARAMYASTARILPPLPLPVT
jgi:hypothetical protein